MRDLAPSPPRDPVSPSEGTTFPRQASATCSRTPSIVMVNFDMRIRSRVRGSLFYGTGLIADASGWVVVDRTPCPSRWATCV